MGGFYEGGRRCIDYHSVGSIKKIDAGNNSASFDISSSPAGVYFYRLTALGTSKTGKVVMIR